MVLGIWASKHITDAKKWQVRPPETVNLATVVPSTFVFPNSLSDGWQSERVLNMQMRPIVLESWDCEHAVAGNSAEENGSAYGIRTPTVTDKRQSVN